MVNQQLNILEEELATELANILAYWAKNTPDLIKGGFYGKIDNQNNITTDAPKGVVLNARILWSFSAAYNHIPQEGYLQTAQRAYHYIKDHFFDEKNGGVYWTVDHNGYPLDTKKQVYAIAFTIYALSEFFIASGDQPARQSAISLFRLLVDKTYDHVYSGYFEAFTRDWQPIADSRLSAKDANEKKTMNTHLHVLEAYTNLFRIWPDEILKRQIEILLNNFLNYFIDNKTHHLLLFFDENWNPKSDLVSYGHDIEAGWLLLEAAEVIGDKTAVQKIKNVALSMAEATIEGLDSDGGLWYEYDPANKHLIKEKHWWPQAEAMVGFYNAWQISNNEIFLMVALKSWQFVKDKILDKANGEWFWGIDEQGAVMKNEDKAGLWKCPYHNSRACIEIIKRIHAI